MAMPNNLVLVRHGQSEANFLHDAEREGWADLLPAEIRTRPDWEHPLTPKGHIQARKAGEWIVENIGDPAEFFDVRLFSTAVRARQTASHLAPNAIWRKHDALIEQDWGEFGITPYDERDEKFRYTALMRKSAKWFARFDGGESPHDVLFRVRDLRNTLSKKYPEKNVLAAAHGGTLMVARYLFENMLPEDYHEVEDDRAQDLGNCAIIWYSRLDPSDGSQAPYIRWRRMIQPNDLAKSPFGGEWQELPGRREYSGQELMAQAAQFQPLIDADLYNRLPLKSEE